MGKEGESDGSFNKNDEETKDRSNGDGEDAGNKIHPASRLKVRQI